MDEHSWHEFLPDNTVAMPPGPFKKIKLFADANIPQPLIDELRSAGLVVDCATDRHIATHPDKNIMKVVRKLGSILLTMDSDFWDDRQHPMQKTPGVIFVDLPPDQISRAIDALAKFYALFAKEFPLDWWSETKARITDKSFTIKMVAWDGQISEDEYRLTDDNKLYTRTIR
jgi:predicted nuclease of predicted toxin-antitoxin system